MYNWIHLVEVSTPWGYMTCCHVCLQFSNHCLWYPLWNPSLLFLSSILNRAHHIHTGLIILCSSQTLTLYPILTPAGWGPNVGRGSFCLGNFLSLHSHRLLPQCWGKKRRQEKWCSHNLPESTLFLSSPSSGWAPNPCSILFMPGQPNTPLILDPFTWQTARLGRMQ